MVKQGAHYKTVPGEQHHERATRLDLNWYQANITKYAERAPHKGQLAEDLIKILDYTCMWMASQHVGVPLTAEQLDRIDSIVRKVVPPVSAIGPESYSTETAHRETGER